MLDNKPHHNMRFLSLGGAGEIGMNLNLYQYAGSWLMVDLGISFTQTPGIEVIMPDPSYIVDRAKKLKGLILTHAHEDHIGAVPHIWPLLRCPIYATPFTAALVRRKLVDRKIHDVQIIEVPLGGRVDIDPFHIEFITLTHSIPEPNAVAITTPAGTVVHTGDWKIDPAPLVGEVTDIKRLEALGNRGVLAMVCDSTNALEEGNAGSEATVREQLIEMVRSCENRVVVACFASNVARLHSCADAALHTGRKIALAGRSLHRIDEAARQAGYLQNTPAFIKDKEISQLSRREAMILCTGSQGEPGSALQRIAAGAHPTIKLQAGDTVIFSSRVIPGNEKAIGDLQNLLINKGIEVRTHRDSCIHVSGHPARSDLRQMYGWVRPQIAIPVHGEVRHMSAHAELARACGVPHSIVPRNGQIIEFSANEEPKVIDEVTSGVWGLDGHELIPIHDGTLKERLFIGANGIVFMTVILGRQPLKIAHAEISLVGIIDTQKVVIERIRHASQSALDGLDALVDEGAIDDAGIVDQIRRSVRKAVGQITGKKPAVEAHIFYQ
jgi:ribonuclease J